MRAAKTVHLDLDVEVEEEEDVDDEMNDLAPAFD